MEAIRNIGVIARREIGAIFNSPIAYVAGVAFLVICAAYLFIITDFFDDNLATVRPLIEMIPLFLIFYVPAITMRLISEERRGGTIELLYTMPVTDTQIILGKYFGGLVFLVLSLALTAWLPWIVSDIGDLDGGLVFAGYIGLLLVGATYLAVGLMTSTWTKNQIIALLAGASLCALFYFVGDLLAIVDEGARDSVAFMSFKAHFNNIARGVIDSRDVIFYLSAIAVALVIATQSLKARNWK